MKKTKAVFGMNDSRMSIAGWVSASWIFTLLLLLALPAAAQLQFKYAITNGAVTITGYTGSGGAGTIPTTIDGLPVTSIGARAFSYCSSFTNLFIPNGITNIGQGAFSYCFSLASVAIGNSAASNVVISIGDSAFTYCFSLASVTIGNGVGSIGFGAFAYCSSLASVTIGSSVTNIGDGTFAYCSSLAAAYFEGNAPAGIEVFAFDPKAIAYYVPGTSGWGAKFDGIPTTPWALPTIVTPPSTQTAEIGSVAGFWAQATNVPYAGTYQWYFNGTNALGGATNLYFELANVQPGQAGAYTLVVTNPYAYGAVTSAPALLSVISPVETAIVPAVGLPAGSGSLVHLEYADSLAAAAPQWFSLSNVTLVAGPQLCLDLSQPLPAQRFYRAWQTNGPATALDMSLATEIPLTGAAGSSVRVDYINQFGPIDAWVTLDTVLLTNTTQPYFDVTMFRRPPRLYRLVALP